MSSNGNLHGIVRDYKFAIDEKKTNIFNVLDDKKAHY